MRCINGLAGRFGSVLFVKQLQHAFNSNAGHKHLLHGHKQDCQIHWSLGSRFLGQWCL